MNYSRSGIRREQLTVEKEEINLGQIRFQGLQEIALSQIDLALNSLTTLLPILPCDLGLFCLLFGGDNRARLSGRGLDLGDGKSKVDRTDTEAGTRLDDIRSSHSMNELVHELAFVFVQGDEFVEHQLVELSIDIASWRFVFEVAADVGREDFAFLRDRGFLLKRCLVKSGEEIEDMLWSSDGR